MKNDDLKHYGILGMHWGIRRASTRRGLDRVASKIGKETKKLKGKIEKRETKNVKYEAKKAKYESKLLKGLGGGSFLRRRSKKVAVAAHRLDKFNKKAVKNLKKIDAFKKLIIKHELLGDVLSKKRAQLSPDSIRAGKRIVNGPAKKEVKK